MTNQIALRKLSIHFGHLKMLRVFEISLQVLPENLGSLDHLEHMKLSGLEVEPLSVSFRRLINHQMTS